MADRTSASITVTAPLAQVMTVIADFAAYPQWIPAIRSAEVISRDEAGRGTRVRFQLDAGVIRDSYVLAYTWDADRAVRWELAEAGSVITEMDGGYLLAGTGQSTTVTYELMVDVRIPMLGMMKRRAEKAIIDTALKGLKGRVEAGTGGTT
jgi:ribosome-associated toxin RatA of RatAB toxin-antitoxin module